MSRQSRLHHGDQRKCAAKVYLVKNCTPTDTPQDHNSGSTVAATGVQKKRGKITKML